MLEKRTKNGNINRIHIDQQIRQAGYAMASRHMHAYYELSYIEQGTCLFFINDAIYELSGGYFILIPPGTGHFSRYPLGSARRTGIYFHLKDIREEIIRIMPGGSSFFQTLRIFTAPEAERARFNDWMRESHNEEVSLNEYSSMLLQLQFEKLLLLCSRCCLFDREKESPPLVTSSKVLSSDGYISDPQIRKALDYINDHFRQSIKAADIASASGFSPNYLSRKFRLATGLGVHEYLTVIRLRTAALELNSTDLTITQIAIHCGFSDSNYFKDAFKAKYGMTPRDYRKKHK